MDKTELKCADKSCQTVEKYPPTPVTALAVFNEWDNGEVKKQTRKKKSQESHALLSHRAKLK